MRFLLVLLSFCVLGIGTANAQNTKDTRYDHNKKTKKLTPEEEAQLEFDKLPPEQKRVLIEVQEEIDREKMPVVKKPSKKTEKAGQAPISRSGAAALAEKEEAAKKKGKDQDTASAPITPPADTKAKKSSIKDKPAKPSTTDLKNTAVKTAKLKAQAKPKSKVNYTPDELREFSLYTERVKTNPDSADVAVMIPKSEPGKGNEAKFQKSIELVQSHFPDKALTPLRELYKADPKNANVNYWLGRAYFESYNNNEKATGYLGKAAEHTDFSYVYKYPHQNKLAPLDALFYTAMSHYKSGNLSEAERFLRLYIGVSPKANDPLKNQAELALQQLALADKMMKEPKRNVTVTNLGPKINTPYADYGAYVTLDGTELYFTSSRSVIQTKKGAPQGIDYEKAKFFDDIYFATLNKDGKWDDAKKIALSSPGNKSVKGISSNSRNLWLLRDDPENIDFYESAYGFDTWQPELSLAPYNITLKWGKNFAITQDRSVIYFASDKLGGFGGMDIFFVARQYDGSWSEPMNVGPNVNTAWDEDMPFLHPNARVLYFSSNSPRSMGGYDVFRSQLVGEWQTPENMGYPINSVGDDLYFTIAPDGRTAYLSKQEKGGQGDLDIYQVNFFSIGLSLPPRLQANFKVDLNKEDKNAKGTRTQVENETNEVVLTNILTREQFTYIPNFRTGNFSVYLDPCTKYNIEYRKNGVPIRTEDFVAPCELSGDDKTIKYDPANYPIIPKKVDRKVPLLDKREANLQGYAWQLQRNGQPVIYMPMKPINYLNAKGEIIKSVKLDSEGIFPIEDIPGDQDYIFEVQVDDENTCGQFTVVMVKDRKKMALNYTYSVVCFR